MNPNNNVHWLEEDESGISFGSNRKEAWKHCLHILIPTVHTHITADDLVKLLGQEQHQRMTLISDTAGMGKSTVLTHLYKHIKQNFTAK